MRLRRIGLKECRSTGTGTRERSTVAIGELPTTVGAINERLCRFVHRFAPVSHIDSLNVGNANVFWDDRESERLEVPSVEGKVMLYPTFVGKGDAQMVDE